MSLSCACEEWDGDGWFWVSPNKFTALDTKRRKRCCSCKELISIGGQCLELERFKYPQDEIEERIYGEATEIQIASYYMCEPCGEILFNLEDLGYCINIIDNMQELLEEYKALANFERDSYGKKSIQQTTTGTAEACNG